MIWDEHVIPAASFEPRYQRRISGVAPRDFSLPAIFLPVHRLLHAASDPRIHRHNSGGWRIFNGCSPRPSSLCSPQSHVCLAQFPSDTPALRRLGLWVHHREPDDSRRTLPSAKRKLVDGTYFLRLEIGDAGRPRRHFDGQSVHPVPGNPFSGLTRFQSSYPLGISSFVVLLATITTFLYLEQVRLVASFFLIV